MYKDKSHEKHLAIKTNRKNTKIRKTRVIKRQLSKTMIVYCTKLYKVK